MAHELSPLLVLGVLAVVGLLSGAAARRVGLAGVTGQILAGVLLGHTGLHLFPAQDLDRLRPVTEFALAIITMTVGGHFQARKLRHAGRRLLLVALAELSIVPLVVYFAAVAVPGTHLSVAALIAALSVSTAPATVVALVSETRSRGPFVKTLVATVALNNFTAVILFEVVRMLVRRDLLGTPLGWIDFLQPARKLGIAVGFGAVAGVGLVAATRRIVRPEQLVACSVITVMLLSGAASWLDAPPMLACLVLGATLANLTPNKDEIVESSYANLSSALFGVFFVVAGMHVSLGQIAQGGALTAAVVAARAAGKIAGSSLALRLAGATERIRRFLGIALVPQAGIAIGLLVLACEDPIFSPIADNLLAIGLTTVAINELAGPFLVRFALRRSGEAGKDRPRTIDFLREENIVTGFEATSKEDAIRKLVEVAIRSNHLDADREAIVRSVLERENEISTAVGAGLAVPHGVLEKGDRMAGAMALNPRGLPFDSPDGEPVTCMVVLLTPKSQRDRHLQVLAALSRAIGLNEAIREQLIHARSPSHADEILHSEAALDWNEFLDDPA